MSTATLDLISVSADLDAIESELAAATLAANTAKENHAAAGRELDAIIDDGSQEPVALIRLRREAFDKIEVAKVVMNRAQADLDSRTQIHSETVNSICREFPVLLNQLADKHTLERAKAIHSALPSEALQNYETKSLVERVVSNSVRPTRDLAGLFHPGRLHARIGNRIELIRLALKTLNPKNS